MITAEFIHDAVTQLKNYKAKIYKLLPSELGAYIKLKNAFLNEGIIISDSLLDKPKSEVVAHIHKKLEGISPTPVSDIPTDTTELSTLDLVNDDVSVFESERAEIRRQIFNNDVLVKIIQTGRAFSVTWNVKMSVCKINIPSTWGIETEQSLLLDLYNTSFHVPHKDVKESSSSLECSVSTLVYDLLGRHSDYSVFKNIIEEELKGNSDSILKGINKSQYRQLISHGLSKASTALLIGFYEQICKKLYTRQDIVDILKYRGRLIKELDFLIISNKQDPEDM